MFRKSVVSLRPSKVPAAREFTRTSSARFSRLAVGLGKTIISPHAAFQGEIKALAHKSWAASEPAHQIRPHTLLIIDRILRRFTFPIYCSRCRGDKMRSAPQKPAFLCRRKAQCGRRQPLSKSDRYRAPPSRCRSPPNAISTLALFFCPSERTEDECGKRKRDDHHNDEDDRDTG